MTYRTSGKVEKLSELEKRVVAFHPFRYLYSSYEVKAARSILYETGYKHFYHYDIISTTKPIQTQKDSLFVPACKGYKIRCCNYLIKKNNLILLTFSSLPERSLRKAKIHVHDERILEKKIYLCLNADDLITNIKKMRSFKKNFKSYKQKRKENCDLIEEVKKRSLDLTIPETLLAAIRN